MGVPKENSAQIRLGRYLLKEMQTPADTVNPYEAATALQIGGEDPKAARVKVRTLTRQYFGGVLCTRGGQICFQEGTDPKSLQDAVKVLEERAKYPSRRLPESFGLPNAHLVNHRKG